jgi:ribonuclease HI
MENQCGRSLLCGEQEGSLGVVIRNSVGDGGVAGAGCIVVVTEALCAEAHVCIAGLQAASDWGMQHVILETDSQILVKALRTEYDRAPGGMLFREAKFFL